MDGLPTIGKLTRNIDDTIMGMSARLLRRDTILYKDESYVYLYHLVVLLKKHPDSTFLVEFLGQGIAKLAAKLGELKHDLKFHQVLYLVRGIKLMAIL
jgi:hypothetical protein